MQVVRNRIAEKILNKLCDAIRDKKTFRVVILLPVHPEGGVFKVNSTNPCLLWQLRDFLRKRRLSDTL